MSKWEPIETAPKDTSLLLTANEYVDAGCWDEELQDWVFGVCFMKPINKRISPEFQEATMLSFVQMYGQPTHWQPLPEPPND